MKPYIIAECGINHSGSMDYAVRQITHSKKAGADVAKFQFYDPIKLLGKDSPYLAYATQCMWPKGNYEYLARQCEREGIEFAVSVFDKADILWAAGLSSFMKIASRMNKDADFLTACLKTRKPVIMSLQKETPHLLLMERNLRFMWCVTKYPAVIDDYEKFTYGPYHGISSHCPDPLLSVQAAIDGARIFENHVTLDKRDQGCDQSSSIEFHIYEEMINEIKRVCQYDNY